MTKLPVGVAGATAMERVILAHMRTTPEFSEAKVKRDGKGRFSTVSSKRVKALKDLGDKQRQILLDKYGEALFESSSMEDYLANLPKGQDPEGTRLELEVDLRTMQAEFSATEAGLGADYIGPEYDPKKRYKAKSTTDFGHSMPLDNFIANIQETADGDALHFGVKGMRWGVRRSKTELAKAAADADPDAIKAVETQAKINAAGTLNVVSSKDLQQLVDRMKLEEKYIKATLESSATTQKGSSILSKVTGLIGRELTMKAQGKDGPLLQGYKFMKGRRDERAAALAKSLKEASEKRKAQADAARVQKERERQAAYNSPSNKRRHPGPADRRTARAERIYNVTTMNASGNPLALPRGRS